jgi:hypothetical protein
MKQIPVYKFKELSPDAQQKAIDHETEFQSENWSGDFTLEYLKEELDIIGFESASIQFSGFWSQGDGASFTAGIDAQKILAHLASQTENPESLKTYKRLQKVCAARLLSWGVGRSSSRYSHEKACYIETSNELPDHWIWEKAVESVTAGIEETRLDLCRQIYADLEADYKDRTSEETARQNLEDDVNDLWFFVDGKPCYYGEA